jgi:Ni/Co efflux regulator RcnB
MRKILMLIGVAAMATVTASQVDAQGRGKGHSVRSHQSVKGHGGHVGHRQRATPVRIRNENRRGHRPSVDTRPAHPHGCPPGLADRTPPCMAPGQANRLFREGQRLPSSYRYFTDFDDIPLTLREQYELEAAQRYILRDNTLYVVDPTTLLVSRIIDLLD